MKGIAMASAMFASAVGLGCCGVGRDSQKVNFSQQQNIVIWDAEKGIEHFVRNAQFDTNGPDLGFIAPTPSKPTLVKVDQAAFSLLSNLSPLTVKADEAGTKSASKRDAGVHVIQIVDVAGYRATTLLASDSHALTDWLNENHYQVKPGIEKWLSFYVKKHWYLTAFKVIQQKKAAQTGVIRMTFKTEKPFNPYYVPKENLGGRFAPQLSLYFISADHMSATIGNSTSWREPLWEGKLDSQSTNDLARFLKLDAADIPKNATLTHYEAPFIDNAKDDLYFQEDKGSIGLILVVLGLVGGGAYVSTKLARTVTPAQPA